MKLKKIVSIIAVSAMSLALLAGCGSGDNSKENTTAAKTEAETTEAETTETQVTDAATEAETTEQDTTEADTTEDASAETGKTLVVYYSATGSTRAVLWVQTCSRSHQWSLIQAMTSTGQMTTAVCRESTMMRASEMWNLHR